jgi:hypothetical protein
MLRVAPGLAALALSVALVACQDSTGPGRRATTTTTPIGTGRGFTLLLTDAPGDVTAAVVTISQVNLQGTGGSVTLLDHPVTVDLIQLQNAVSTLVRGLDVPAGSYSQLRLVISGGYIQSGNEIFASSPDYEGLPPGVHATGTLVMPSLGQSGLKIDLPGGKLDVGADETIVMIDFNAAESFGHEAGHSGRWVMHPVIKATNVTFGGNVLAELQLGQGVTLPPLNGQPLTLGAFAAVLMPAAGGAPDTIPLTLVNGTWEALFKGLLPGDYSLTFIGPPGLLTTFTPTLPVTVTVLQKQTTTVLVTLTSAAFPGTITATLGLGTGVTLPTIAGNPVTLSQFKALLTPPVGKVDTTAFSTSNGTTTATFLNLVPGTYSLTVLNPAGTTVTYNQTLPIAINLTSGANVNDTITIKTATAP